MQEVWRRLIRTLAASGEVSIELSVAVKEGPQLAFHDHWDLAVGRAHELWLLGGARAQEDSLPFPRTTTAELSPP
jgi:hypothetical protein